MASKTHGEAGGHGGVGDALDRLYAAPLDDFVARRRELASALRAAGDVAGSKVVAAASKPSRTAWALNQVARRQPELVRAVFDARTRAATPHASSDDVRATARAFRERLAELVQAAGEVAREEGSELTIAQGRRISATVQAAAVAEDAVVRERLIAGRLVADIDVDDPFAGLEVGPPREKPARHEPEPEKAQARSRELESAREREREKRARELEQARTKVAALEEEAREARAAARDAEVAARRAQADAERLRRTVEAVEKKLSDAKVELRNLGT
jgi:hypothetical protein